MAPHEAGEAAPRLRRRQDVGKLGRDRDVVGALGGKDERVQ
jgi:hypothetical protein